MSQGNDVIDENVPFPDHGSDSGETGNVTTDVIADVTEETGAVGDVKDSADPAKPAKVDLLLKAVGDTPIMKKKHWQVEGDKLCSWVIAFIRRYLKLQPSDSLFVYVNQSFAPSPDHSITNLYQCFGSEGRLVLNYCRTQAWG